MSRVILFSCAIALVLIGCPLPTAVEPVSNMNLTVRENVPSGSISGPAVSAVGRDVATQFYIGLSRQDVFDTLSDPDHIFYGDTTYTPGVDYDADAYHMYFSLGLSFRIFGDTVMEITLLNDNWIASNGLVVGMSREQMLEILGDDYQRFESAIKDFYEYGEYDISVEVYHADDSVGEININEGNAG